MRWGEGGDRDKRTVSAPRDALIRCRLVDTRTGKNCLNDLYELYVALNIHYSSCAWLVRLFLAACVCGSLPICINVWLHPFQPGHSWSGCPVILPVSSPVLHMFVPSRLRESSWPMWLS